MSTDNRWQEPHTEPNTKKQDSFTSMNMKEITHIIYNVNGNNAESFSIGRREYNEMVNEFITPTRIELIYAKGTLNDWIAEVYFEDNFITITNIDKIYRGDYKVIT